MNLNFLEEKKRKTKEEREEREMYHPKVQESILKSVQQLQNDTTMEGDWSACYEL